MWKPGEERWQSYNKTKFYKKYLQKTESSKKTANKVEMEVNNKLEVNYDKIKNVIRYFTNTILGKLAKEKWKVKVWLDEKSSRRNSEVTCGVALVRPNKSTIYSKKVASSLNEAVKQSFRVVEKSVKRESKKLSYAK